MPTPPATADDPDAPKPPPIRFYGTCWVDHSRGYALRRAALGAASLVLALAGGLLLWLLVFGGTAAAWLRGLAAVALALCTAMAFVITWQRYTRPAEERADETGLRSIKIVGFAGVLLAYGLRSAVEAPGERLRRAEHEAAVERYRRSVAKRSGNPARRRRAGGRRRRS